MSEGLIDKNAVGVGVRQFHVGVAPGEVGTVALLPGDPFRVPLIAEFLEDAARGRAQARAPHDGRHVQGQD